MSPNSYDRFHPMPLNALTKEQWEQADTHDEQETREQWEHDEAVYQENLVRNKATNLAKGRVAIGLNRYWKNRAACQGIDPDIFFPHDGAGVEKAQKICNQCPVAEPCLEFALAERIDHGVWGGISERERRRILRQRRLEAKQ